MNDPQKYWHFSHHILESKSKQSVKYVQNTKDITELSYFKNHACHTPQTCVESKSDV